MNKDILQGKWTQIRGEARKQWGKLTDDDMQEVAGEKDKLLGKLQQRYGNTEFFPAFNFDTRGIPGAVGQTSGPFPMTVVDEKGKKTRNGSIGEIVIDLADGASEDLLPAAR